MITIEVNDAEVQAVFQKLLAAADDLSPFFESVGERLTYSSKQRFTDGKAPDDTAWKFTAAQAA